MVLHAMAAKILEHSFPFEKQPTPGLETRLGNIPHHKTDGKSKYTVVTCGTHLEHFKAFPFYMETAKEKKHKRICDFWFIKENNTSVVYFKHPT